MALVNLDAHEAHSSADALLSGSLLMSRSGALVVSTLPSVVPREIIEQIGRVALFSFASARKVDVALTHVTARFRGLRLIAHDLCGGTLVFLNPGTLSRTPLALPAMNHHSVDDFILYLETYNECWKQFQQYLQRARKGSPSPEEEGQFLEIKSLIVQGLEAIVEAVGEESGASIRKEATELIEKATSLHYLAENSKECTTLEREWHSTFLGLQSILGKYKVRQQKQLGDWDWDTLLEEEA